MKAPSLAGVRGYELDARAETGASLPAMASSGSIVRPYPWQARRNGICLSKDCESCLWSGP